MRTIAAMITVCRTTLTPIRNRLIPGGLEGEFAMQLRNWLSLPAPVLKHVIGDRQQKESHARIKDEHSSIYDSS